MPTAAEGKSASQQRRVSVAAGQARVRQIWARHAARCTLLAYLLYYAQPQVAIPVAVLVLVLALVLAQALVQSVVATGQPDPSFRNHIRRRAHPHRRLRPGTCAFWPRLTASNAAPQPGSFDVLRSRESRSKEPLPIRPGKAARDRHAGSRQACPHRAVSASSAAAM
jgi:hypothetical protein